MKRTFMDIIRSFFPVSKQSKHYLEQLTSILSEDQLSDLRYLVKTKKVGIVARQPTIGTKKLHRVLELHTLTEDQPILAITKDFNRIITKKTIEDNYKLFSKSAKEIIGPLIAPNILGMENEKKAALLQLFSKERFHILLIGDPGTGKTDILRSAAQYAPISSFGLGSGTSGAGLSVAYDGKELKKGLLTKADNGLCCIDELNLMKKEDRAALYSAMEKGFVTYDKGGKHEKVSAKVRVFATANPKADKFIGKSLPLLKEQLPFDSALLTRFHLVFIIRKPDAQALGEISKQIVHHKSAKVKEDDMEFIRSYIEYALKKDIEFPTNFEATVTDFIKGAKKEEDNYLVEIGPRTVHGVIRLAQAHARMQLKTEVEEEDIRAALDVLSSSFTIPGVKDQVNTKPQSFYGKKEL